MSSNKIYYGLDAPKTVRNLFFLSAIVTLFGLGTFLIQSTFWFWLAFLYCLTTALSFTFSGFWMLYSSYVAKPRILGKLLDELALQGHETVLDVGCGRGLFLIEAAKQVPHGKVCGIDLWSSKDQSRNAFKETTANAKAANVSNRIEIKTADMRQIPYPDCFFDAVISSLAIHNIPSKEGRKDAFQELLRVLKPGGKLMLFDILVVKEYADILNTSQRATASCSRPIYTYCPPARIVRGEKHAQ